MGELIKPGTLVRTRQDIEYQDVDGVERVMPAGTPGVVRGHDPGGELVTIALGDNEFDLDESEIELCR